MKNTPAAVYARYSSDNQREESIEAQTRAIKEYAERNGYDIVATYVDEARITSYNVCYTKLLRIWYFLLILVSHDKYDTLLFIMAFQIAIPAHTVMQCSSFLYNFFSGSCGPYGKSIIFIKVV